MSHETVLSGSRRENTSLRKQCFSVYGRYFFLYELTRRTKKLNQLTLRKNTGRERRNTCFLSDVFSRGDARKNNEPVDSHSVHVWNQ